MWGRGCACGLLSQGQREVVQSWIEEKKKRQETKCERHGSIKLGIYL